MALLLKYLLLSGEMKGIGILLRVEEIQQTEHTMYCEVGVRDCMSEGCVCSCDEEQGTKGKMKIT